MAIGVHTNTASTATIYQFPVGGRSGVSTSPDTRDALRGMMSAKTARHLDWRAFYHSDAIADEPKDA